MKVKRGDKPMSSTELDAPEAAGTTAASALSDSTPAKCQTRTRLYRDGTLELEGFPVAEISDHITDESVTVWLDLRAPRP
jgi:hypothetical protein